MLVTIVSENRHNVTSRSEGLEPDRIKAYYTNPNTDFNGTTLIEYSDGSLYSNNIILLGVSETAAHIAAGGTTSANTIFTVKKKIGW